MADQRADDIDDEGFRANVGIVLADAQGRLFWGRRVGKRGWQFPQGGVAAGEEPTEAMYRELGEEIGLGRDAVTLLDASEAWLRYRLPERFQRRQSEPRCIGQKQRWYLLRLDDEDGAIDLQAGPKPEFDDWCWKEDYWAPAREVIYFKRHVYEQALDRFLPLVHPEDPPPKPDWLLEREAKRRRGTRRRR